MGGSLTYWNWDEIFINYCAKDFTFENLCKDYRERHGNDGPAVGTIFKRSKDYDWEDRKKKWIADKQDTQLEEIKKREIAEFKKGIGIINEIIDKMSKDVLAKLSIPKQRLQIDGAGEIFVISKYNASFNDLDKAIKLKKLMIEGNGPIKGITLTLNYPVINMSPEDKRDYEEFVKKDFEEKAIDVDFEIVDPGEEE